MIALLPVLFLANSTPPPSLSPYRTIDLAKVEGEPIHKAELRSRVFIDEETKSLIVVHNYNQVSVFELATGKLTMSYNLGVPYGDSVLYRAPYLVSFPNLTYRQTYNQQVRERKVTLLNLKTQVESRTTYNVSEPEPPFPLPQHPEWKIPVEIRKQTDTIYLLSNKNAVSIDKEGGGYDAKFALRYRPAPDFGAVNSVPIPFIYFFRAYLTPDSKMLGFQDGNDLATHFYSIPNFTHLGTVRNQTGELSFDPHSAWAINHGYQLSYHKGWGGVAILANLKTFQNYHLDQEPENERNFYHDGVEDAVVDSKLDIAVTIRGKDIRFYRLPK